MLLEGDVRRPGDHAKSGTDMTGLIYGQPGEREEAALSIWVNRAWMVPTPKRSPQLFEFVSIRL
jgi:hypothetical protein